MTFGQLPLEILGVVYTLICTYCEEEKVLSEFPFHSGHKNGYDTRCKACKKKQDQFRKLVEKYAPPCPMFCEVPECGNLATSCDHDHTIEDPVEAFRGWLCSSCNTTIGAFGDTVEGIKEKSARYIAYLEKKKDNG